MCASNRLEDSRRQLACLQQRAVHVPDRGFQRGLWMGSNGSHTDRRVMPKKAAGDGRRVHRVARTAASGMDFTVGDSSGA